MRFLKKVHCRTACFGGEGEIRTHETREGSNGFQDRRVQPLCHLSAFVKRTKIIGITRQKSIER